MNCTLRDFLLFFLAAIAAFLYSANNALDLEAKIFKASTASGSSTAYGSSTASAADAQPESKEDSIAKLETELKEYIKDYESSIGLYYYDLETGGSIEINSSKEFIAASTIKVPMNMVLLDLAHAGKIDLESSVKFIESDYEDGTGILQNLDLSKPIPLKTLSEYSIVYSDNIAAQMIIRKIGRDRMYDSFEEMLGHEFPRKGNLITPADAAAFLKILYSNPDGNPYYDDLVHYMKNTVFHDCIDKYIPQEKTAHKVGAYDSCISDIAIVYTDKPYIIAIYINGLDNAEGKIAHISKMIYDYQNHGL